MLLFNVISLFVQKVMFNTVLLVVYTSLCEKIIDQN